MRLPGGLRQQIEIKGIIPFLEKRLLPPIAPLCDMVRDARKNEARKASHDSTMLKRQAG
jgi:hypothetical protein